MAIQIVCQNCGPRTVQEFVYGEVPDPEWTDDVGRAFMKRNLPEPTIERWFHIFGCRRWTTITRDRSGR